MRSKGYRCLWTAAASGLVLWRASFLLDRIVPVPDEAVDALGIAVLLVPLLVIVVPRRMSFTAGFRKWVLTMRAVLARALRFGRRRAAALSVAAVVFFVAVHAIRGPVRLCGTIPSDCQAYVALVESLDSASGAWERFRPHHAMRILPPLLVRGTMAFGLTIDQGFRVLSVAATLGFGLMLLWVFHRLSGSRALSLGLTLLILGLDRHMTVALRDIYRTLEPLGFLIGLSIIVAATQERHRLVGFLDLLGVMTKQPLLILGALALAFVFLRSRDSHVRIETAVWGVAVLALYGGLGAYYGSHEAVASHVRVTAAPRALAAHFVGNQGLEPLMGLVPLLLLARGRIIEVARRYWFVVLYSAIALAQPIMLLGAESAQSNLIRTMLQGVWPLYLLAGVAIAERHPSRVATLGLLVLGAFFFDGQWSTERRVLLVTAASVVFLVAMLARSRPRSKVA